ncbi:hypothetical protein FF1_020172 [Malus domestica]
MSIVDRISQLKLKYSVSIALCEFFTELCRRQSEAIKAISVLYGGVCCAGLSRTVLAAGTKLDWLRLD